MACSLDFVSRGTVYQYETTEHLVFVIRMGS